jgi:predicted nucleic acid-binding protein
MIYLVDTNVLLRSVDPDSDLHRLTRNALEVAREKGFDLVITSQNCIELWNVLTRPASRNGRGFTIPEADNVLQSINGLFRLLPDSPAVYPTWRRLVNEFGVSGVQGHDARLTAFMVVNAVPHILTLNGKDFSRYRSAGVLPVSPEQVVSDNA